MKRASHPLQQAFTARIQLLATTLRPSTVCLYKHTARLFMSFLCETCPEVRLPSQLRRDPHILSWLQYLWMKRVAHSQQPLCASSRAAHLIRLRTLLDLLADHKFPPRPSLLLNEDIPRVDQRLPRPLTPEDDARLQAELRRRNDLLSNALLLTRLTGMRIGETVDLAPECLRHLAGEQWVVHVPIGKLHSERWTPVDEEVRAILNRITFLRTLPPKADPSFLLPRPKGRTELCSCLRQTLRQAAAQAGIAAHIVPHQLRHTYATTMLRAGVSLPALMKLLGHRTANMTLLYVEVTQQDLQREFYQARRHPRHLLPLPGSIESSQPARADLPSVLDRLSAAIRLLDLVYQQSSNKMVNLLLRRLRRVRTALEKVSSQSEAEK